MKDLLTIVQEALWINGTPPLRVNRSTDFTMEDHTIYVTELIHIQVPSYGDGFLSVVKSDLRGSFIFYPETLDLEVMIANLNDALTNVLKGQN